MMPDRVDCRFRLASIDDAAILADFNCRLAEETEGKVLDRDRVSAGVANGFLKGDEVRYFVAEDATGIIAQVLVTREWSDWRNGWMSWLQSVYVRADRRRRGVLRRLIRHAVEEVQRLDASVCVRLYVEHENEIAANAYRQIGFVSAGYDVMEMPLSSGC